MKSASKSKRSSSWKDEEKNYGRENCGGVEKESWILETVGIGHDVEKGPH